MPLLLIGHSTGKSNAAGNPINNRKRQYNAAYGGLADFMFLGVALPISGIFTATYYTGSLELRLIPAFS